MQELTGEMETRIIDAATLVFVTKGKSGTSMQDIAEKAGINRPLLNYYFRSKDRLFELVFIRVFIRFLPEVAKVFSSDLPVAEKLSLFIDTYFNILNESPLAPLFILNEISVNPDSLITAMKKSGINPNELFLQIEDEMKKGLLKKENPRQLMVNLLALVIFPFAAKPMIQELMFGGNPVELEKFMEDRKQHIKEYFIKSIKA
jgi:TetR/AcrR family transcriptional regulator